MSDGIQIEIKNGLNVNEKYAEQKRNNRISL